MHEYFVLLDVYYSIAFLNAWIVGSIRCTYCIVYMLLNFLPVVWQHRYLFINRNLTWQNEATYFLFFCTGCTMYIVHSTIVQKRRSKIFWTEIYIYRCIYCMHALTSYLRQCFHRNMCTCFEMYLIKIHEHFHDIISKCRLLTFIKN